MGAAMLWESNAETLIDNSFQKWIHDQEGHLRLENYLEMWNYFYGYHRDSLNAEIRDSMDNPFSVVSNFCSPVVNIVVDHLAGEPINLDCSEMGQKTPAALKAESILHFVYEANGFFDDAFIEYVRIMAMKGDVFLHVSVDDVNGIGVNVLRPDIVFPKYLTSNFKVMEACAVKSYRVMEDGAHHWIAQVWRPDVIETYDLGDRPAGVLDDEIYPTKDKRGKGKSKSKVREPDNWRLVDIEENMLGAIPIFHTKNNIDAMPFGVSDIQVMIDLQDALNKTITDMMHTMDNQAFQRLFIFGGKEGEPYRLGPGVVLEIANESGSVQAIPPVNVTHFLYSIDSIIDQICAVTNTPRQAFQGYSDVPTSGLALSIRMHQLELKCNEKKANIRRTLRNANWLILSLAEALGWAEEGELANVTTKVKFPGGLPKDDMMTAQVHMMELQMGIKSRMTIMEERGIENIAEEIARINVETAAFAQEEGQAAD